MTTTDRSKTFNRNSNKKGLRFLLILIVLVGVGVLGYSDLFTSI